MGCEVVRVLLTPLEEPTKGTLDLTVPRNEIGQRIAYRCRRCPGDRDALYAVETDGVAHSVTMSCARFCGSD